MPASPKRVEDGLKVFGADLKDLALIVSPLETGPAAKLNGYLTAQLAKALTLGHVSPWRPVT